MPKVKKSRARLKGKFGIKPPSKPKKRTLSKKEKMKREEAAKAKIDSEGTVDSKGTIKGKTTLPIVDKPDVKNDAAESKKDSIDQA
eukprot:CAMPEP_0119012994 /NCGR_PEP_ID=MMETSP1176-20130426/7740_1 /TAXON_ID=265551 /ORGANISM="Synedropsis recta cf, Strain CCMP1620" /LENGTH=85 /DNA_ID=CAMNT_0006966039 /DNA_START=99 /DNA_END=353 /DNA_ORIENTATION=+